MIKSFPTLNFHFFLETGRGNTKTVPTAEGNALRWEGLAEDGGFLVGVEFQ